MNVKLLNRKQIKWVIKLAVYNFMILYYLEKSNSANASLKQPDYQEKKQMMNHFLPFLQQKLTQTVNLKTHK